ncbi:MAG: P-loop NTPase [Acetobacteraceae bacterium]
MKPVTRPLHLVERAALLLREEHAAGPESALLPEEAADAIPDSTPAAPVTIPGPANPEPGQTLSVQTLEGAGMIISREQRDRIAEEFRIVGQQVLAGVAASAEATPGRNLVMVTSARPGEGKSFAALNLAASLALSGERPVILVDADIRAGSLTETLGLQAECGLLDLVASPAQLAETAIVRSRVHSLHFLPIGGGSDLSGRALISTHNSIADLLKSVAGRLRDRLFIVDAPACLSSSDPSALAAVAGQVLLVVEAEQTRRREIEAALDLLDTCRDIRLLLNKVRVTTRDTFGIYS